MKTMIAIVLAVMTTTAIDRKSDAYKLGWIEGRAATLSEASSLDHFHECVRKNPKLESACWAMSIDEAKQFFKIWNALSDGQKLEYARQGFNHRWMENLNGANPYDVTAYFAAKK